MYFAGWLISDSRIGPDGWTNNTGGDAAAPLPRGKAKGFSYFSSYVSVFDWQWPYIKNSCLRLMWNPRQDRSKQALSVSHGFPPLPLIACGDWSQPCRSEQAAGLKYTQQAKNVLTGFPWSEENNCYLFAKLHMLVSLIQHFTEFHQNPPVTRELCQGCKLSLDVTHS